MAKLVTHFKCLVVSPSDVESARAAAREALLDWNAHAGEGFGVKVEAVMWESHARPAMGGGPQDVLNEQIVDGCDFALAFFHSRLGSPTAQHASGSVEEIERLVARGANVMVYFCNAPIPQDALKDDQYARLQEIKRTYRERGLLSEYTTAEDLRRILPLHINGQINSMLMQQRGSGQPIPSQGTVTAPLPDIRVTVKAGRAGREMLKQCLIVEVQNHSPNDFYFSTLTFELADGSQLFAPRDLLSGAWLTPQKIEPGNSYQFLVDPFELVKEAKSTAFSAVAAKDKIDRCFRSPPGALASAIAQAERQR